MGHYLEEAITGFLQRCIDRQEPLNEELIEEFGERCKAAIRKSLFEPEEKEFRLRMSNIGKDLRQLQLEKKYGRPKATPNFAVTMLLGNLYEALYMYFLKSGGIQMETDVEVELQVESEVIKGTTDIITVNPHTGKKEVYDIKSASPYSYDNKFVSFEALASDDAFGYVGQGFGYASATGYEFKGWLAINKSNGAFRTVLTPTGSEYTKWQTKTHQDFAYKIDSIRTGYTPACTGVEAETFYSKLTGNKILGKKCQWCPHKAECHPGIKYEPSRVSKAKTPKMEHYVK